MGLRLAPHVAEGEVFTASTACQCETRAFGVSAVDDMRREEGVDGGRKWDAPLMPLHAFVDAFSCKRKRIRGTYVPYTTSPGDKWSCRIICWLR